MQVLTRITKLFENAVVRNTIYLGLLKGAELILPLITFPYLVRVLGPENFGLIAFSVAINAYFVLFTDYGFSLSATRKISIERQNQGVINNIYSSVMSIKLISLIVCFLVLLLLISIVPRLHEHFYVYLLSFGAVIGNVLFPIWLYQGFEQMRYITILNLASKVIYLVLVFSLITKAEHFWMVPALNGSLSIVFGLFALVFAQRRFGLTFSWPSLSHLITALKDGWYVFQSKLSINVYTASTTVILGFFAGNTAVGFYSAGEKIVKAAQSLYAPFGQAIYPYVCKMMAESESAALALIRKVSVWVGMSMLMVSLALFFSAEWLVQVILGDAFEQSIVVVKVLAFLPFIVALSNIYGIQTLLNMGYQKTFSIVLLAASILGVCLSVPLVYFYSGIGSAIVVLSVEVFVTLAMAGCLLFYRVDVFPRLFSLPKRVSRRSQ
jgi:PST family polysaccharide transporter